MSSTRAIVSQVPDSSNENNDVPDPRHGQFSMKELAKELAPLVVNAMRNTEEGQRRPERTFRSPRNGRGGKAAEGSDTQERLAFLVSK